jgi:hypothetical protein
MLGTKHKDDYEPYCKTRRTGSASSNSCPPIIQRRDSLPPTSSGTWSAMQILRTQGRWHFLEILTPALTGFYFPFRLPRRKRVPELGPFR